MLHWSSLPCKYYHTVNDKMWRYYVRHALTVPAICQTSLIQYCGKVEDWIRDYGCVHPACPSVKEWSDSDFNFNSFRKAVKAACKCKTKECPAWDCWCDDEDEETGGSCRCPTCDCDVCSSCKVINNMLSQSFVWAQMFYHLTISLAVWVWSFPLTVSLDYTIASQMALL